MDPSVCVVPADPINDFLEAARSRSNSDLSAYTDVVKEAMGDVPPVFFRPSYGDFFSHCATTIRGWMPRVVVACAQTENSGSKALFSIWQRTKHQEASVGLLRHARDEERHSHLFLELAEAAFGKFFLDGFLSEIKSAFSTIGRDIQKATADFIDEPMLFDCLMQLNIVEVRTRLHLQFLAPAYYALTPPEKKSRVGNILTALASDEDRHITYTAELLDNWIREGNASRAAALYACRLQDYNRHTLEHCDSAKHDYGQGKFPALFVDTN